MGLRLHNSYEIAKGVRLNVSPRGFGVSFGSDGLRTSIGPNGTYVTAKIPGTNVYLRSKLSPSRPHGRYDERDELAEREARAREQEYERQRIEERRRKSTADAEGINAAAHQMAGVSKLSPHVLSAEELLQKARQVPAFEYRRVEFAEPEPMPKDFKRQARRLARQNVKGLFNISARRQYAHEQAERLWRETHAGWTSAKEHHELLQCEEELRAHARYATVVDEYLASVERLAAGETQAVEASIGGWLEALELPVAVSVSYELHGATLFVDLDLPELEDVPTHEATVSSAGELEIKKRTQASARAVYAQCVFGVGIFVAANLFNRAPTVRFITMSAYTQRKDAQGELCDDYVYSVKFTRDRFEGEDLAQADPEAFLLSFENRCSLSTTKIFRAIAPYEVPPLSRHDHGNA